jgi:hypothetical protein
MKQDLFYISSANKTRKERKAFLAFREQKAFRNLYKYQAFLKRYFLWQMNNNS